MGRYPLFNLSGMEGVGAPATGNDGNLLPVDTTRFITTKMIPS